MKISELIKELQSQMAVTGNTEMRVYDTENEFDAAINSVRYCADGDYAEIRI